MKKDIKKAGILGKSQPLKLATSSSVYDEKRRREFDALLRRRGRNTTKRGKESWGGKKPQRSSKAGEMLEKNRNGLQKAGGLKQRV